MFGVGLGLLSAALALTVTAAAADFDLAPQDGSASVSHDATQSEDSNLAPGTQVPPAGSGLQAEDLGTLTPDELPVWLDAGDVPTAYTLPKYGLRTDFRLYEGGGIVGKAYIGLFSRFFIGGGVNVPNFVGAGPIHMTNDDAQVLARLQLLAEEGDVPAIAVGWDGPAYDHSEAKGLYVSASKQVAVDPCVVQFHGGVNAGTDLESFVGKRDLRADAAMTVSYRNYGAFTSLDEILYPSGPRWCAGLQATFDPITVGLEFQDLASVRPDTLPSRLIRLAWNGNF
jgi:hypothetical protein